MRGEPGQEESDAEAERNPSKIPAAGASFYEKSALARIAIIAAGPGFNFILAFLFSLIIIAWAGYDPPKVIGVIEGYPAEAAGIQAGDVVTSLNGKPIGLARDITCMMFLNGERSVSVSYERYDETAGTWTEYETVLTPKYSEEAGTWYLGVQWNGRRTAAENPLALVKYSVFEVRTQIRIVIASLRMLVSGRVSSDDIAGPVRIVAMIDQSVEQTVQYGIVTVIMNLFNYIVMFSANLGVMNLLPVPALDGGRLVFLLWELLTRRPLSARIENTINTVGLSLLMSFMLFVLFNDVRSML